MVVLLAERTGAGNQVNQAHLVLGPDSRPVSRYYRDLIQADQLARRQLFGSALAMTNWNGDDLVRLPDPFFSTITHLLRAEWYSRMGNTRDALSALLWHEADDFGTFPLGEALAPEVDLAFGTMARWMQARMLDNDPAFVSDVCRGYRAVARYWSNGSEVYRGRAAFAKGRLAALPCDEG
jgi:hypothetical protein